MFALFVSVCDLPPSVFVVRFEISGAQRFLSGSVVINEFDAISHSLVFIIFTRLSEILGPMLR